MQEPLPKRVVEPYGRHPDHDHRIGRDVRDRLLERVRERRAELELGLSDLVEFDLVVVVGSHVSDPVEEPIRPPWLPDRQRDQADLLLPDERADLERYVLDNCLAYYRVELEARYPPADQ